MEKYFMVAYKPVLLVQFVKSFFYEFQIISKYLQFCWKAVQICVMSSLSFWNVLFNIDRIWENV